MTAYEIYRQTLRGLGKTEAEIDAAIKRSELQTGIPAAAMKKELSPIVEQSYRAAILQLLVQFYIDPESAVKDAQAMIDKRRRRGAVQN